MFPFSLTRILTISRPRFWIYLLGPCLLGLAAVFSPTNLFLLPWRFWWFLLFFSFPANFLVYGVNDIFDYETDKDNPKKQGYEALVLPHEHSRLWKLIGLCCLPFFIGLFGAPLSFQICFAAFLFFSLSYSAPPLRMKGRPFFDAVWNVLYVFPGLCLFFLLEPQAAFPWLAFFAAWLWCIAMHAYSAVPDIWADRSAKLETIATRLGRQRTLWFCLACYALSAILASEAGLGLIASLFGLLYVGLMGISLSTPTNDELMRWYRRFPLLNTICGAVLFFSLFFL